MKKGRVAAADRSAQDSQTAPGIGACGDTGARGCTWQPSRRPAAGRTCSTLRSRRSKTAWRRLAPRASAGGTPRAGACWPVKRRVVPALPDSSKNGQSRAAARARSGTGADFAKARSAWRSSPGGSPSRERKRKSGGPRGMPKRAKATRDRVVLQPGAPDPHSEALRSARPGLIADDALACRQRVAVLEKTERPSSAVSASSCQSKGWPRRGR